MPAHYCIHPLDPHAERVVLVTFEDRRPLVAIGSAIDETGHDIMPTLSEECVRNLQLEIAVYHGRIEPYGWAHHAVDVLAAPAAS